MTTEQTQHARDSAELRRLCSERDQLREKVAEQAREIERLRMQLVACGVVALANTPESAAKARDMHPDYMSASCGDVIRTVDIQMQLRAELTALKAQPDPWKASGADWCSSIHSNPDAKAWADFFVAVFPGLTDKHDLMLGWFANAMMAMHDHLKAQPGGVVQWPDADEIMQMAFEEGQPSEDASGYYFELEEFDLFIQRLMEEVARLNQPSSSNTIDLVFDGELPNAVFVEAEDGDGNSINAGHWFQREDGYLVLRISSVERQPTQKESDAAAHRYLAQVNKAKPASAGDERATLSAFTAWGESIGLRPALQTVGELKAFKAGAEWKARADLSAPSHSEQVREGWQLVPVEPIDAMLEAGDKYIGTPATYKAMLSACPSPAITKDFSQFLSAVMDAAGLIRHGRQSKELSEYLGMKCMEYRAATPSAGSQEQGE